MSELDLARTQFAMTSIYHFLFVPVTIGLSFLIALLQTTWHRTGKPEYLRLTKFFGTLLMINIAVGVVTGLVQEFQFGMNWSAYARTVGDVFGAPLAMEGLAAFFLESTFLGLWIFGWNMLSPRIHLLTIWAVALGGVGSAAFIMAANSWMQNPVGYEINPDTGLPQLNNIAALLTNPVFLRGYLHVVLASLITGAVIMLAVAAWQLRKGKEPEVFQPAARLALVLLVPTLMVNMLVGSELGVTEADLPADEDRRVRGAVGDVPAVLVLGLPDRRRQERPRPGQDHPDPAPAVAAGHQLLEREGPRPRRAAEHLRAEVRARASTCPTCSSSTGRCASWPTRPACSC